MTFKKRYVNKISKEREIIMAIQGVSTGSRSCSVLGVLNNFFRPAILDPRKEPAADAHPLIQYAFARQRCTGQIMRRPAWGRIIGAVAVVIIGGYFALRALGVFGHH